MPSIEFSKILCNLLIAIVSDENLTIIDRLSSTVNSLHFGIDKLKLLGINKTIFESKLECNLIREQLLTLILMCLNNIFTSKKNLTDIIDVNKILEQLFNILECELKEIDDDKYCEDNDLKKCDIIFGIYYYSFIIINNTYLTKSDITQNKFYDFIIKVQGYTGKIFGLIKKDENSILMFKKITKIFLKIICNIRITEDSCSSSGKYENRTRKLTKKNLRNNIPRHHKNIETIVKLKCLIENELFALLNYLTFEQIKPILKFLQKTNNFCCCNLNLNLLSTLFTLIKDNIKYNRFILNLIKNNFINLLLSKCCDLCCEKINSIEYQVSLVQQYISVIDNLYDPDITIILDHIGTLSRTIPFSFARKIIFEIAIPVFENFKLKIMLFQSDNGMKDELKISKTIVHSCLNIFSNYLIDTNLINDFYTEENVKHLNDLMGYYEIVPNVFRLIKLGLNYFNDNDEIHRNIRQIIINMPINNTITVTNNLLNFFYRLNNTNENFNLKIIKKSMELNKSTYSILFELRLAAVYWNMILQLLQTNEQFKNEFKEKFKNSHEDYTLIYIIYNTLSCILNLNQMNNNDVDDDDNGDQDICNDFSLLTLNNFNIATDNIIDWKIYEEICSNSSDDIIESYNRNIPKSVLCNFNTEQPVSIEVEQFNKLTHDEIFKFYNNSDDDKLTEDIKPIFNINDKKNNSKSKIMYINDFYRKMALKTLTQEILTESNEIDKEERELNSSYPIKHSNFFPIDKINQLFSWIFSSDDDDSGSNGKHHDEDEKFSSEDIIVLKSMECRKILFQLFEITLSIYLLDLPVHIFGELLFYL